MKGMKSWRTSKPSLFSGSQLGVFNGSESCFYSFTSVLFPGFFFPPRASRGRPLARPQPLVFPFFQFFETPGKNRRFLSHGASFFSSNFPPCLNCSLPHFRGRFVATRPPPLCPFSTLHLSTSFFPSSTQRPGGNTVPVFGLVLFPFNGARKTPFWI